MGAHEIDNQIREEKEKSELGVKEEYLEYIILDGTCNGCFGTINTSLEKNMTCGLYSYPRTKYDNMGILNN